MAAREWKDHPAVLLGGAFAAGVVFALTIALPVYTTAQQNAAEAKSQQADEAHAAKLKDAEGRYAAKLKQAEDSYLAKAQQIDGEYRDDKEGLASVRQLRIENATLQARLSSALVELYTVSSKKPFLAGNPLPIGMSSIKIGDPEGLIKTVYRGKRVEKDDTYYYVELPGQFINQLQIDTDGGKIIGINYYVEDTPAGRERLLSAATAAFGPPTRTTSSGPHGEVFYKWTVNKRAVTVLHGQYSVD